MDTRVYNVSDFIVGNGINKYLLSVQIDDIPTFPTTVTSISSINLQIIIYFAGSITGFEAAIDAIVATHDPDTQFDNEPGVNSIYASRYDSTPKFLFSATGSTGALTNLGNISFTEVNIGNFGQLKADIGVTGSEGDVLIYGSGSILGTTANTFSNLTDVALSGVTGGNILRYNISDNKWCNILEGGTGDLNGPSSSTDNTVVKFDGTSGKLIQDSGIIIDDSDNITGVTTLAIGGSLETDYCVSIRGGVSDSGLYVMSGDNVGTYGLRMEDADQTFKYFAVNADQGNVSIGGWTGTYGIDLQLTAPNFSDINVASVGMYRIGGVDVVDVTQTMTNKTISDSSNTVGANELRTTGSSVVVDTATAPTTGQVLTAISATEANWQTSSGSGDVTGPGVSLDLEIAVYDGTSGKIIQGAGVRHYGASTTDPTVPTPQAGDKYYNTAINEEMAYDGTRSKWLSVTTIMDGAGRNGNTNSGLFYRRWNGMTLAASLGPYIAKGTIVRIGYATSVAAKHTYEVLVNGVVVSSLASSDAASAFDDTLNDDFPAGIMSSRNGASSDTTNNFQSAIYYKLRP